MSDQAQRIGEESGANKTDPTALTTDALHREIAQVRELLETKIHADNRVALVMLESIQRQLTFLESQRQEQKADTKQAVVDALAAAKEAVGITAANTKEQITSLSASFTTTMNAFGDKFDDLKNTVTANASATQGRTEGKAQMSDSLKLGIAIIGSVVLLIGFFITMNATPGP